MELIDIYDENKEQTGRTALRGTPLAPDEHCLIAHICLFNHHGQMLAQQRSMQKSMYPGVWDLSAGGFVKSGEDALDAVIREAKEELGLSLNPSSIIHCLTEPFSFVFDEIYIAPSDADPSSLCLQPEELMSAAYFSREEVLSGIRSGTFVDYPIPMMERVFDMASRLFGEQSPFLFPDEDTRSQMSE